MAHREFSIRVSPINATAVQWQVIRGIEKDGVIIITPEEIYNRIGFFGGLTAKFNIEEKGFWSTLQEVARNANSINRR
jgi:hypothetical protein